jgi:hypothetical protein
MRSLLLSKRPGLFLAECQCCGVDTHSDLMNIAQAYTPRGWASHKKPIAILLKNHVVHIPKLNIIKKQGVSHCILTRRGPKLNVRVQPTSWAASDLMQEDVPFARSLVATPGEGHVDKTCMAYLWQKHAFTTVPGSEKEIWQPNFHCICRNDIGLHDHCAFFTVFTP